MTEERQIEFIRVALVAQEVANNANAAFWADSSHAWLHIQLEGAYDRLVAAMAALRAACSPKETGNEEVPS